MKTALPPHARRSRWPGHALLLLIVLATAASGQETRVLRLEIAIWPEYDRPEALVMLRGQLPQEATLPTTVTLAIPAGAGSPHAVAQQDPSGKLFNAEYEIETDGEWSLVHLQTSHPSFRLEYYAPIERQAEQRRFLFGWPGGLDIREVGYEIQQPLAATGMTVTPAGEAPQRAPDGLLYHVAELGPRLADDNLTIEILYAKADDSLSASQQSLAPALPSSPPVPTGAGAAPTGPAPRDSATWWLVAAVAVAGAFIGAGVAFLVRGRR